MPMNLLSIWPKLRSELLAFPSGRHDDQVDALSLFVQKQTGRRAVNPAKRGGLSIRAGDIPRREGMERNHTIATACLISA